MTNIINATESVNRVANNVLKNENVQNTINKSQEVVTDSFQNSSAAKTVSGASDTDNLKYIPAVYLADLMLEKGFQRAGDKSSLSRWAKIGDKISDIFHLDKVLNESNTGRFSNFVKNNRFLKYFTKDYQAIPKCSMAKPRAYADELLGNLSDETTSILGKLKLDKDFGNRLKSGAVSLSDDAMEALTKAGTMTEPMSDDFVRNVVKALREAGTKLSDADEKKALGKIRGELVKYLNNGKTIHGSKTVISMLKDDDVAQTIATTLSMLKDKPELATLSPQSKQIFNSIIQNADDVAAKIPKEKVSAIVEELISKGILDEKAVQDGAKGLLGSLKTSTKQKVLGLKNKVDAQTLNKGKTVLGKYFAKGAYNTKRVMTMEGGLFGALFTSMALAQTIKATKEAPEGEKLSTFMHVLSEQYLGMILYQPSINLMYKLGGNKYRGMTTTGKKALHSLVTNTNIKVDSAQVAKLQQKLIRKGISPEQVAKMSGKSIKEAKKMASQLSGGGIIGKVFGFIKSPIGSIAKIFKGKPELSQKSLDALEEIAKRAKADKPIISQTVKVANLQKKLLLRGVDESKVASLAGKSVKEARKLAKSLGKEGAKLKFWEKPLKSIANLLTTGLDTIKGVGAGKAGSKLKGFAGGLGRFALIMFVLQPILQKPLTKLCHKIFGEPKTYLAKQKEEENTTATEQQNTQNAAMPQNTNTTNLLDMWTNKQVPTATQPVATETQSVQPMGNEQNPQTQNIQITNNFGPAQQQNGQEEIPALNIFKKDKPQERYIPSIEVNFTEDTSEIDAKAAAMIKASDSMIKEVRKYL